MSSVYIAESNPCTPNPCLNGGRCTQRSTDDLTELTFECNCEGTGYEGATCERGIVTVPTIPTLSENHEYKFNISARPQGEIFLNIESSGQLHVYPDRVRLTHSTSHAEISVTGSELGQYSLHYTLSGTAAETFDLPEDSQVFVGPGQRTPGEINAYFRSVKSEVGYLNESCCISEFTYPECPMTTDAVIFLSTCSWTTSDSSYSTNGIVFARFKSLGVPLSISGTTINYSMGTIDTSVPRSSVCKSCEANRDKIVTQTQTKLPEGAENCYYYDFKAGDVSDFLTSYALATTYINRVSSLFPSWVRVELLQSTSSSSQSISDGDFSTALVEQEGVSSVKGCENLLVDSPGLYSVLTYSGGRSIQLRINEETQAHQLRGETMCLAVNLCQEMNTPVYSQLPQSVQDNMLKLTVHKPYQEARWTYTLDAVTFYQTKRQIEVSSMYWNGTDMYLPYFPGADMEIRTSASSTFSSFKEGYVRIKAEPLGGHGVLSLDVENADVCINYYIF